MTTGADLQFATSRLSYGQLAQHLVELDNQRRNLEEELEAGSQDLYQRRLKLIHDGAELPGAEVLGRFPTWRAQARREQVARSNAEIDREVRRDPRMRGLFSSRT